MPVTTFHPDELAAAYDFLRATPPFKRWKLPESDALGFAVTQHTDRYGHLEDHNDKRFYFTIAISSVNTKKYADLLQIVSHEMIHLKLRLKGKTGWGHGYEFKRLAKQVCRVHDFDFATFI